MKKVILLRYGELYLKGKNKGYFERVLLRNIKTKLQSVSCSIKKIAGRYLVADFDEMDLSIIIEKLQQVFGLVSISVADEIATDVEVIENYIKNLELNCKTFRVSVTRANKSFPINSNEFEKILGGIVLDKNPSLKVSLKNFETEVVVDIRESGQTFVLTEKIMCQGGMPLTTAGKGLLLLSGGIDSPVAGYMMAKRGMEISALHFHSFPYTSEQAKQKVIELAKLMTNYCGKITLYCCPFTEVQESIHKNCSPEYMITLMRRIMMKIASKVCKTNKLGCIITGENLGQVASQTLESMTITNSSQQDFPVFRPLVAFDKKDIIKISEKIGTFETSILPYEDCCTVFLPDNPIIKPKLDKVLREEEKLDINTLVENAFNKIEIVEC